MYGYGVYEHVSRHRFPVTHQTSLQLTVSALTATVSKLAETVCVREIGLDHGLGPLCEKGDRVVDRQDPQQVPGHADTIVKAKKYLNKKLDLPQALLTATRNAAQRHLKIYLFSRRNYLVDTSAAVSVFPHFGIIN